MWFYSLIIPEYRKTSLEYVINKALENNDADYITDVNVIESDHLIIFFGVKSIKISGEGWKKIDGEQNILKKPYFNPQTGELITD